MDDAPFKKGDVVEVIDNNTGAPVSAQKIPIGSKHTVVACYLGGGSWMVDLAGKNMQGWMAYRFALAQTKSDVEAWFDDKLSDKTPKKKERVPDELDWEKHKQFMRSLG